MPKSLGRLLLGLAVLVSAQAGCGGGNGDQLVIYSGRNEKLVKPILDRFARSTGVDIRVRYAETTELTPTLLEEGASSRADVFFSQDAGALAALARRGRLAPLPRDVMDLVEPRFRDPQGRWVGVSGRARVVAYNTARLKETDLPQSVLEVGSPRWARRVGFPPTNASFVAFVSALIEQVGRDRTRAFLEALKAGGAKRYDNNVLTLEAVARGEVDVGLVNHYYLYNEFKERPGAPVANHFPGQAPGGEGTFVNVAGVGILAGTDQAEAARRFVRFLLEEQAQAYFRDETAEYPLRRGSTAIPELPPLDKLRTIDVPLDRLGRDLEASQQLLREVGLT